MMVVLVVGALIYVAVKNRNNNRTTESRNMPTLIQDRAVIDEQQPRSSEEEQSQEDIPELVTPAPQRSRVPRPLTLNLSPLSPTSSVSTSGTTPSSSPFSPQQNQDLVSPLTPGLTPGFLGTSFPHRSDSNYDTTVSPLTPGPVATFFPLHEQNSGSQKYNYSDVETLVQVSTKSSNNALLSPTQLRAFDVQMSRNELYSMELDATEPVKTITEG
ncbi:hypothetical protein BGZ60DRAFT_527389 [Tricladium varicosporioides]|nr:hypothetical protein BGZ60DRAFT_527389 [Hymenoscyphus varicosporioides]